MSKKNSELSLPTGVAVFSKGALEFLRPPTQEEWEQIGRYVVASRSCSLRWIADWRRTGRRHFGDEAVAAAEQQLELEYKDLKSASALEALEGRGADAPSDEHAFVAGKMCSDPAEQTRWLDVARAEKLSAVELRRSIEAGRVVRESEPRPPSSSAGYLTLEGISLDFKQWLARVQKDGFPQKWDAERLVRVRELLNPIREVAADVSVKILQGDHAR